MSRRTTTMTTVPSKGKLIEKQHFIHHDEGKTEKPVATKKKMDHRLLDVEATFLEAQSNMRLENGLLCVAHLVGSSVIWVSYKLCQGSATSAGEDDDEFSPERNIVAGYNLFTGYCKTALLSLMGLLLSNQVLGLLSKSTLLCNDDASTRRRRKKTSQWASVACRFLLSCLVGSLVVLAGITAYTLFYLEHVWAGVLGSIVFLVSTSLSCYIWKRIPLAVRRLRNAICVVQQHKGLLYSVVLSELIAFMLAKFWMSSGDGDDSTSARTHWSKGWGLACIMVTSFLWIQRFVTKSFHPVVAAVSKISIIPEARASVLSRSNSFVVEEKKNLATAATRKKSKTTGSLSCVSRETHQQQRGLTFWLVLQNLTNVHLEQLVTSLADLMLIDILLWFSTICVALGNGVLSLCLVACWDLVIRHDSIMADEATDLVGAFLTGSLAGYLMGSVVMGVTSSVVDMFAIQSFVAPADTLAHFIEAGLQPRAEARKEVSSSAAAVAPANTMNTKVKLGSGRRPRGFDRCDSSSSRLSELDAAWNRRRRNNLETI